MASWGARLSDREKAFSIGRIAIDSAKLRGYPDLEGLAYNLMGILFMQATNSDSAEFYYSKAEETAIVIKDSGLLTTVMLNRAKIALGRGDAKKANEFGFRALEVFEEKNDINGIAFALQIIGQNFVQLILWIVYYHPLLSLGHLYGNIWK